VGTPEDSRWEKLTRLFVASEKKNSVELGIFTSYTCWFIFVQWPMALARDSIESAFPYGGRWHAIRSPLCLELLFKLGKLLQGDFLLLIQHLVDAFHFFNL
jgi:hypothetical protein